MKIYTKTGDRGETSLFGGTRVGKDDARVEAYGTVDELNAALGVARAEGPDPDLDGQLEWLQGELFTVGAALATPGAAQARRAPPELDGAFAEKLEAAIDRWEEELPPLTAFVLPCGTRLATALHVARAVARRAERRVVALCRVAEVDPKLVAFLNRLSDFLFVAARIANRRAGVADVLWHARSRSER
jgi:cob(I)alamin adenosyltransferase